VKYIVNKLGVLVKPRPPSPYGYYIGLREGTWCKKCADRYWLYKAYLRAEGTFDKWVFITEDTLYKNFVCSTCTSIITGFSSIEFYKKWDCYNRLYYICKDFKHFLYNLLAYKIISQSIFKTAKKIKFKLR